VQKFTSYERDTESGLNFAQARMFAYNHGRFTTPDTLAARATPFRPQSWNRYVYVLNNPLRFVDPTGLIDEESQEKEEKDIQLQQQLINVKIEVSPAQVFVNEKLPDGRYLTGVGSKLTITITDANNKPLAGATVTETNKRVEGSGEIIENKGVVTTNSEGQLQDYVVKGKVTDGPGFGKQGETVEDFKNAINETKINSTTEQTLTVKDADGSVYQITYRRSITNIDSNGNLVKNVNENGVNVTVTATTPVVKRLL
jgi:RHS repeat-associated protein